MSDPYSSHLPVLESLSSLLPMRRVLELGCGQYSTPFFLSLPGLERLVSLETDGKWLTRVLNRHGDSRLELRLVEDVALNVGLLEPRDYDFVFIDNGPSETDREAAIRQVLGRPHPPVVIHDAEVPRYSHAITQLGAHHVTFSHATPATALVWQ